MEQTRYTYRFLARFIIEAATPLCVRSGEDNFLTDASVATDLNGLPYIPATAIAGVLRHALGNDSANKLFGSSTANGGCGSEIIFTSARMIGEDGKVNDGLKNIDFDNPFYRRFLNLPIRQHVKIGHDGTGVDGAKFDGQVVFKGTRFCFEMEMLAENMDSKGDFKKVIDILKESSLRLGGSTRNGYGEMTVRSIKTAYLCLTDAEGLKLYMSKSSNLNSASWPGWSETSIEPINNNDYHYYELQIKADDFFILGSNEPDVIADMTSVKEHFIEWKDGKPSFATEHYLIPGSSVKGAVAHRTAYNYNILTGHFADKIITDHTYSKDQDRKFAEKCEAVKALFGYEGEKDGNKITKQKAGNVYISDLFITHVVSPKILNHIAIDRFTGGVIDGALFDEEVVCVDDSLTLKVQLKKNKDYPPYTIEALEMSLKDICEGMLPLGGGTNRGHGYFCGKLFKDGKEI